MVLGNYLMVEYLDPQGLGVFGPLGSGLLSREPLS